MSKQVEHHRMIQQLMAQQVNFAVVIITDMKGSAPQEPGAKMLVTIDSEQSPLHGTIGGGKLELFAIEHAKKLLATNQSQTTESMTLNLQSDLSLIHI